MRVTLEEGADTLKIGYVFEFAQRADAEEFVRRVERAIDVLWPRTGVESVPRVKPRPESRKTR